MQICLSEIQHCQETTPHPNFIVLLGDRYGWCPLPTNIPVNEFEELLRRLPASEQERRQRQALLDRWYRRDDNAVPPVFYLLPCEGVLRDYASWEPVALALHAILCEAVKTMPLTPEQRLKCVAFATEQEITYGAFRVTDAQEHVFCALHTIQDLPRNHSAHNFIDLNASGKLDSEACKQLDGLKRRLEERLPNPISRYEAAGLAAVSPLITSTSSAAVLAPEG